MLYLKFKGVTNTPTKNSTTNLNKCKTAGSVTIDMCAGILQQFHSAWQHRLHDADIATVRFRIVGVARLGKKIFANWFILRIFSNKRKL